MLSLGVKASPNPIIKLLNTIRRTQKLKVIKRKFKIDTTVSLLSGPNIVNILSRDKDKIIVSVRNYVTKSEKGFYGALFRFSIKHMYNRADSIVAGTNALKQDLVSSFGIDKYKIKVIYNFYDIQKINELCAKEIESEYQYLFKGPTIITVGRLSTQKGQWHLIRAFKRVIMEVPDAKLLILGKGELNNYLEDLVTELSLEGSVVFLGFNANPFKYIKRATLFVFPSLYEGFPNALCEAMVCGAPVISSDCESGPREILAPNTDMTAKTTTIEFAEYGVLVPVCDGKFHPIDTITHEESLLAQAIINYLKEPNRVSEYARLSKERASDFSKTNILNMWEREL